MGRKPNLTPDVNGSVSLRTNIPPHVWRLVSSRAAAIGVSPTVTVRLLMEHIDALLQTNDVSWLPPDWQVAFKAQRNADSGLPPNLVNIDLTKLHRSEKTKSGYVGVYANGKGFRATGRRGEYLGQFDSAVEAAYKRLLHYRENKLPYGELELEIDRYRQRGEQGNDEQLKELVLETARLTNTMHYYLTPEDAERYPRITGMIGFDTPVDSALEILKAQKEFKP